MGEPASDKLPSPATSETSSKPPVNPPAVLALHGFTGCGEDFAPFAPLCRNTGKWSRPDLPGHGTASEQACDPESVEHKVRLHASNIARPRILLGYSMGARAALLHATHNPGSWDALILISGNPGLQNTAERQARAQSDEELARWIETKGVKHFLRRWHEHPLIQSQRKIKPPWRYRMLRHRLKQSARGLADSLRGFGPASCPDLWPHLHKLRMPVLLLCGEEDQCYAALAELMAARMPRAHTAIIEKAGHMPHLENPQAAANAIQRFVKELAPGNQT